MPAHKILENRDFINPLEIIEDFAFSQGWIFEQLSEEEIVAEATSKWANFRIWSSWRDDLEALVITCSFEHKVPENSMSRIYHLLNLANEKLWIGHFELSSFDNIVSFRHSLQIPDIENIPAQQIEELLEVAIFECSRFYPAFQNVIWGERSADEAMAYAMIEPIGEA